MLGLLLAIAVDVQSCDDKAGECACGGNSRDEGSPTDCVAVNRSRHLAGSGVESTVELHVHDALRWRGQRSASGVEARSVGGAF